MKIIYLIKYNKNKKFNLNKLINFNFTNNSMIKIYKKNKFNQIIKIQ